MLAKSYSNILLTCRPKPYVPVNYKMWKCLIAQGRRTRGLYLTIVGRYQCFGLDRTRCPWGLVSFVSPQVTADFLSGDVVLRRGALRNPSGWAQTVRRVWGFSCGGFRLGHPMRLCRQDFCDI